MSLGLTLTKIADHFFLAYELIVGNRRLILPTMIGLIIAFTVISQSGVLIESYREEIFEEIVFSSQNESSGDITVNFWGSMFNPQINELFTNFTLYEEILNQVSNQEDYSSYISENYWFSSREIGVWGNISNGVPRTEEKENITIHDGVNFFTSSSVSDFFTHPNKSSYTVSDFFTQLNISLRLEKAGRIPTNASEIILIRPEFSEMELEQWYTNLTLGSVVNITLNSWSLPQGEVRQNKTVKIVGIIEYEYQGWYYVDYAFPPSPYSPSQSTVDDNSSVGLLKKYTQQIDWGAHFLSQPSFFKQAIEDIFGSYDINWHGRFGGKIIVDKSQFDAYNLNEERSKLQSFINTLEETFILELEMDLQVYSNILNLIEYYENVVLNLIFILIFVSLPVLLIALYLVDYSFKLIRRQKQEQIGIIKTRGGSRVQILIVLLGEIILSSMVGLILGIFFSMFLADLVMRSTNYLEFLGAQVPIKLSLELTQGVILWGIIIAIFLNIVRIIRMSKQKISETLIPTETKPPAWKRFYLDIFMFAIGTASWLILMTLIRSAQTGNIGIGYVLLPLFFLLGIPAPFFMYFGTIMIIARIFPHLMKKISDIFWKLEGGINAFAIRNIVRHKQAANRAVLLITMALSFSILASSLIFSLDETTRLQHYYKEGADVSVDTGNYLNTTIQTILQENVSHLQSTSGVINAVYETFGRTTHRTFYLLFVDPSTYAETAFYDPSFGLSGELASIIDQLTDNKTLILFEGNMRADNSKIGENFSIKYEINDTTSGSVLSYKIGGTFRYWPTLYPYEGYDYSEYHWLIGSLGMFDDFMGSQFFRVNSNKYLSKVNSDDNIEETITQIYNETNISSEDLGSAMFNYKEYQTSFNRHFSLSILNSDLIISITISVIGVIMFAFFIYVERGKEIGVERALGMTQIQTAQSFLVEAIAILAFGTVIGFITGAFFVSMFLQLLQLGQTIPPVVVTYPTTLLAQMVGGILMAAGVGTVIPAYLASRKDISRILKVE
ncbi:MAG: FtsX-like permease family protein [Candidatus Hodarchaeales archaeon]|jgi:ABC-type antimicrobial peptide transport system permease subunit